MESRDVPHHVTHHMVLSTSAIKVTMATNSNCIYRYCISTINANVMSNMYIYIYDIYIERETGGASGEEMISK